MRRLPYVVALVALLIAALVEPARAQTEAPFHWERFDVEVVLHPDGTFSVAETQALAISGTLRRGFREIPLDRIGGITEISVEEPGRPYTRGSDRPYTYSATRDDGSARIDWWFPATTGSGRTFILRYRVDQAIRVYEGGDQLRWIAVYADRPAPVRSSTVTLRFPSDVTADQVQLATYAGRGVGDARLVDARTAQFTATDLAPGQAMEIRAQFPHGLVAADRPAWQQQADFVDWWQENARPVLNFFLLLATLGVAVLGGLALAGAWYARGRDPAIGAVPRTLAEPPGDLPAGVVGTLVDERADVQDVVATLVELANRGVIRITEERNPELQGSSRDFHIELLQDDRLGLRAYERTIIGTLFRGDAREVRLSDLKTRFVGSIPLFQDQLHAEAARAGLFHGDPERARRRYRSIGTALIGVGIVGVLLSFFVLSQVVDLAFLPFLALLLLGIAARWLAGSMPRRTRTGALEAARWRAFGEFLRSGGARGGRLDPDGPDGPATADFERWLPYAIALGADQTWVRNLASVGTRRPRWLGRPGYPGRYGGPNVVILPSPWGGGTIGGGVGPGQHYPGSVAAPDESPDWGGGPDSPQDWSDSLADLLNRTSDVLSHGGGSGWSGGGGGGGGGGGSGGGSGGFS